MPQAHFSRRRCLALLGSGAAACAFGSRRASAAPARVSDTLGPLPLVFAVHGSMPARDMDEFARCATSIPGGVAYGSTGAGSSLHVAAEQLLEQRLRVQAAHVPYHSLEALAHDLASGHIHAAFGVAEAFAPFAHGHLRILGVGGRERLAALPRIKTFAEQGFDDEAFEARVLLAKRQGMTLTATTVLSLNWPTSSTARAMK